MLPLCAEHVYCVFVCQLQPVQGEMSTVDACVLACHPAVCCWPQAKGIHQNHCENNGLIILFISSTQARQLDPWNVAAHVV